MGRPPALGRCDRGLIWIGMRVCVSVRAGCIRTNYGVSIVGRTAELGRFGLVALQVQVCLGGAFMSLEERKVFICQLHDVK